MGVGTTAPADQPHDQAERIRNLGARQFESETLKAALLELRSLLPSSGAQVEAAITEQVRSEAVGGGAALGYLAGRSADRKALLISIVD